MDEELEFLRSLEFADAVDQDRMDAIVTALEGLIGMMGKIRKIMGLQPGVNFVDGVSALLDAASGEINTVADLRRSLDFRSAQYRERVATELDRL